MSNASTDETPAKRVRIDINNNKLYDYTSIAGSVATLLPVMKDLVNHYLDLFMKTSKAIYDKKKIIEKLANSDFIPKSAKTKFQLGASELVKSSNEYNDLATAVEQVKAAYERKQKLHILQSARMEMKALLNKRDTIFIEGIFKLASMMQLWKTSYEDVVEGEVHHIIKQIINMDNSLLMHVFDCKYESFIQEYTKLYPLSITIFTENNTLDDSMDDISINEIEIPPASQRTMDEFLVTTTQTEPLTTQDNGTHTTASLTTTEASEELINYRTRNSSTEYETAPTVHTLKIHDIVTLTRILKDIFVHSWSNEKTKLENKLLTIKMAKFSKMTLTAKATDDAAAIVANEPSADMKLIEELINKKVNERTKKLQNDLNETKQRLNRQNNNSNNNNNNGAKNSNRGEKSTRPNQNTPKRQNQTTARKQQQPTTRNNNRAQTPARQTRNSTNSNIAGNNQNNKTIPRVQRASQNGTQRNGQHNRQNRNLTTPTKNKKTTSRRQSSRKKADVVQQGTPNGNSSNRRNSNRRLSNSRTSNSSTKRTKRQRQQN
jgi:hypothetical protein